MRKLGADAFRECITSGGDIAAHLNSLLKAPHSRARSEMLSGALSELLRIYCAVRAAGYVHHYDDAAVETFMHGTPSTIAAAITLKLDPVDGVWLSKHLTHLVAVVCTHRTKITFSNAQAAPTPTPLQVQIVGMPERVIESKVTYDKDGNIASTTQTEKDAAD